MASFTEKAIRESFLKLLMERPLSQITVKDIVIDCGVNRNTFYYHFADIPELLEKIIMEDFEAVIREYPTVERIEDCLDALVGRALQKRRAVLHIYNSVNRELCEQYLWKVCDYVSDTYTAAIVNGRKIRENDLSLIKEYLASLCFGIVSGWLRKGMDEGIRAMLYRICEIKKGMVEEMLSRCEEL